MKKIDFVIKYNPDEDTLEDIAQRVIYALFNRRLKDKKPAVAFISGDSGEGKSTAGLILEYYILKAAGVKLEDYVDEVNVYTPLEYPQKLDRLLHDKTLKKVCVVCMHEAREVVKAKLWHNFVTQAVADINAMSRSIKRMVTLIVSQFIRDISTDIRYTLNYYIKVERPTGEHFAKVMIYRLWKDDRDLHNPQLRKVRLRGYLVYPNGRRVLYCPNHLQMWLPPKEIMEKFEASDLKAKKFIIKNKIDKLIKELKVDIEDETARVFQIVNYYKENMERISDIGKRVRGRFRVTGKIKELHNLNKEEAKLFEEKINEHFTELERVENEQLEKYEEQ